MQGAVRVMVQNAVARPMVFMPRKDCERSNMDSTKLDRMFFEDIKMHRPIGGLPSDSSMDCFTNSWPLSVGSQQKAALTIMALYPLSIFSSRNKIASILRVSIAVWGSLPNTKGRSPGSAGAQSGYSAVSDRFWWLAGFTDGPPIYAPTAGTAFDQSAGKDVHTAS